jgi:hypothetical protein
VWTAALLQLVVNLFVSETGVGCIVSVALAAVAFYSTLFITRMALLSLILAGLYSQP